MIPLPKLLANNSLTDVILNIKGKELEAHKALIYRDSKRVTKK